MLKLLFALAAIAVAGCTKPVQGIPADLKDGSYVFRQSQNEVRLVIVKGSRRIEVPGLLHVDDPAVREAAKVAPVSVDGSIVVKAEHCGELHFTISKGSRLILDDAAAIGGAKDCPIAIGGSADILWTSVGI